MRVVSWAVHIAQGCVLEQLTISVMQERHPWDQSVLEIDLEQKGNQLSYRQFGFLRRF